MSAPTINTSQISIQRADDTLSTAKVLHSSLEEWAAVCYFYAAYHTVRAAMMDDPVFNNMTHLATIDPRLTIGDKQVTHHQARIEPGRARQYGVNDVVRKLYPSIYLHYARLHNASIAVRYGLGLGAVSLETVANDYKIIRSAYDARLLLAIY